MKTIILACALSAAAFAQSFPNSVYVPLVATDNVQTTLRSGMLIGDNVAIVASGTGWVANMVAYICDSTTSTARCTGTFESMLVTNVNGQVLTVTRGYGGTSAVSHATGKTISNSPTSAYPNSLGTEIRAMQKFGGSGRYVDLRAYGAVCDGTTNVQPAVTAAIAAGYTHLFLPANCVWVPTANTMPDHLTLEGEDWETSWISSDNPTTNYLVMGANSTLNNVSLNDVFCYNQTPVHVAKRCPIRHAINMGDAQYPIGVYPRQQFAIITGTSYGSDDRVPISITETGIGDALFLGVTGNNGAALRIWTQGNNSPGITIQNGFGGASTPTGVKAIDINNYLSDGASYGIYINRIGNGPGLGITDGSSTTGIFAAFSSTTKTSGQFVNIYHSSSAYADDALTISLANSGGSFAGNFINLSYGGVSKFAVQATGIPIMPAMKATTGTRYVCADTNGALAASASACSGT